MKMHPSIVEATRLTRLGRLGEASALLRSMAAEQTSAPPVVPVPPPATVLAGSTVRGGGFERHEHHGTHGRLGYKLYVPSSAGPGAALIVMLHGCTQGADDFAAGTGMNRLADAHGFLVAYPEQTRAANPSRCWNWFRPGDQARDAGEPALIAGATRAIAAQHAIDPARIYVAGLSAGGAAAAVLGEAYPDLYAAVGIHSGLACGAAHDMGGAMTAMRRGGGAAAAASSAPQFVPTIVFHGDRDTTVDPINGVELIARARRASAVPLMGETEDGAIGTRRYRRDVFRDPSGTPRLEQWTIHGGGHAWSGGDPAGSYTDPNGPDASGAMVAFFEAQARG